MYLIDLIDLLPQARARYRNRGVKNNQNNVHAQEAVIGARPCDVGALAVIHFRTDVVNQAQRRNAHDKAIENLEVVVGAQKTDVRT